MQEVLGSPSQSEEPEEVSNIEPDGGVPYVGRKRRKLEISVSMREDQASREREPENQEALAKQDLELPDATTQPQNMELKLTLVVFGLGFLVASYLTFF